MKCYKMLPFGGFLDSTVCRIFFALIFFCHFTSLNCFFLNLPKMVVFLFKTALKKKNLLKLLKNISMSKDTSNDVTLYDCVVVCSIISYDITVFITSNDITVL